MWYGVGASRLRPFNGHESSDQTRVPRLRSHIKSIRIPRGEIHAVDPRRSPLNLIGGLRRVVEGHRRHTTSLASSGDSGDERLKTTVPMALTVSAPRAPHQSGRRRLVLSAGRKCLPTSRRPWSGGPARRAPHRPVCMIICFAPSYVCVFTATRGTSIACLCGYLKMYLCELEKYIGEKYFSTQQYQRVSIADSVWDTLKH